MLRGILLRGIFTIVTGVMSVSTLMARDQRAVPEPVIAPYGGDSCEMNLMQEAVTDEDATYFEELVPQLEAYYKKNIAPLDAADREVALLQAIEIFGRELELSRLFRSELGTEIRFAESVSYMEKAFGPKRLKQKQFLTAMLYWIGQLSQDNKLSRSAIEKLFFAVLAPFGNMQNHSGPTKYDLVMDVAYRLLQELYERFDEFIFHDDAFRKKIWDAFSYEYLLSPNEFFYGHERFLNSIFSEIFNDSTPYQSHPPAPVSGSTYTVFRQSVSLDFHEGSALNESLQVLAKKPKRSLCQLVRGQKFYLREVDENFEDPMLSVWEMTVVSDGVKEDNMPAARKKIPVCKKGWVSYITTPDAKFMGTVQP